MANSTTYLEFLLAAEKARNVGLDPLEERLLCCLAVRAHDGAPMTVVHAMNLELGVSSTTTHRRLKSLRSKGFINLVLDEVDTRVKHILPTDKAIRMFDELGRLMVEASGQADELPRLVRVAIPADGNPPQAVSAVTAAQHAVPA